METIEKPTVLTPWCPLGAPLVLGSPGVLWGPFFEVPFGGTWKSPGGVLGVTADSGTDTGAGTNTDTDNYKYRCR